MKLTLTVTLGNDRRTWPLDAPSVKVGRSSQNGIQIADATVSKEHAEIFRNGPDLMIRDLGSRNGTRVNGIECGEPTPIRDGDTLEIGKVVGRIGTDFGDARTVLRSPEDISSSLRIRARDILARPLRATSDMSRIVHLLAEAGRVLVLPRPLHETCAEILGFVERAIQASRIVILLQQPGESELVQIASRARGGRPNEPLAISRSILEAVMNEVSSVVISDTSLDDRFKQQQSIIAQSIHSALAVPLFDNENVLGVLYADSRDFSITYGEEQLEILTLLANMAAVKITNARLLEQDHERKRMEHDLRIATRIQRNLLPEPPDLPGWEIDARIETCHEVGGDLYDFHTRPDGQLVFLIGDVTGKGMGAALLMSSAMSSLRTLYDQCSDPAELVTRLNHVMHRTAEPGRFVTLFVGLLDPSSGRLRYVNAGHNPPLLIERGVVRPLEAGGVPVAILAHAPYEAGEITLEPGALLAGFTDGIPEADRGGEMFEDERLVETLLASAAEPTLDAMGRRILGRVDEFLAGTRRTDDITLLLVRRDPAA
jgi:serine phosphatase RsbU (regulator of sigma subunit)